MLNCLKQNKGFIVLILILILLIVILISFAKEIDIPLGFVIGILSLCLIICLGTCIHNIKECIKKNERDEHDVIKDLMDITIPNNIKIPENNEDGNRDYYNGIIADYIVLKITDSGNNIIKLKTLQTHFYKMLKDLIIEDKNDSKKLEIDEVKIYIKKVNSLIAKYNLTHSFFT